MRLKPELLEFHTYSGKSSAFWLNTNPSKFYQVHLLKISSASPGRLIIYISFVGSQTRNKDAVNDYLQTICRMYLKHTQLQQHNLGPSLLHDIIREEHSGYSVTYVSPSLSPSFPPPFLSSFPKH